MNSKHTISFPRQSSQFTQFDSLSSFNCQSREKVADEPFFLGIKIAKALDSSIAYLS